MAVDHQQRDSAEHGSAKTELGSQHRHLIGLDLLRALAISAVLIAHFGTSGLRLAHVDGWPFAFAQQCGFYGVELFFALSGFLIGGLLLEIVARDPSPRALGIFLVRRWMRTLPLYVLWICVLLVVLPPADLLATALKYLTLTQNLAWPMPDDNWFGVSWSLAIEEWFYLLFSTLLLVIAVRSKRFAVIIACAIFAALPLAARLVVHPVNWDDGMRKVVALRLDAIAYGVLIAWAYRLFSESLKRWRYPIFALGLALAFLPMTRTVHHLLAPHWPAFVFTFSAIGFALLMPWAVTLHMPFAFLRACISWLAGRSYCIYIVHVTLQQLMGEAVGAGYLSPLLSAPLLLLACAGLAELSYRYFETPILRRRPPQFTKTADAQIANTLHPAPAPQPV